MLQPWTDLISRYPWMQYVLEILLLILAAWFLRRLGMDLLRKRARREKTTLYDQLLGVLDHALLPILLLAVLAASLNLFPLSAKLLAVLNRSIYVAFLAVTLLYASRCVQILVNHWLVRSESSEAMRQSTRFVVRLLFAIVGLMIVLENVGISLTALWTTLGVGSVAVALALQDTLSNFFGGVYLQLDRPVRIGDYIKLGANEEGYVQQLGWRSTRLRTLGGNIVVIPNSKLATATVTNYSLPAPEMSLDLQVGVSYDSDPEKILRILIEEGARAANEIDAIQKEPTPSASFLPGFGESSLNFTLSCRVRSYVDQYAVRHQLNQRILARFRREGIVMPFPQRDVHLHGDHDGSEQA